MTISFSGLSSGLDTSSWIEALVSVKQTTISSLQAANTKQQTTLNALSSLKSYFSTFQSALDVIKTSAIGGNLSIFKQNNTSSSNSGIATATATTAAARQSYNVLVKQLASNTKASSGYYTTQTKKAENDTTMAELGVTKGTVTVNSNSFNVYTSDTVEDLLEKFEKAGVEADYDNDTGKFTIKTDKSSINVTSSNLLDVLNIENTNIQGYKSGSIAKLAYGSNLEDLGITDGTFTIDGVKIEINGNTCSDDYGTSFTFTSIGTLLDGIINNGLANFSYEISDGNISIEDVTLTAGTSNILDKLNLNDVHEKTKMTTGALSFKEDKTLSSNTTIADLGLTGKKITKNGTTVYTGVAGDTLANVKTKLAAAGINIDMDVEDGKFSFDTHGTTLAGDFFSTLGSDILTPTGYETTFTSTPSGFAAADLDNITIAQIGALAGEDYSEGTTLKFLINGQQHELDFNDTDTLEDVRTSLSSCGVVFDYNDSTGQITLTADTTDKYSDDPNALKFFGSFGNYLTSGATVVSKNNLYESSVINYKVDGTVDENTKLSDLGVTAGNLHVTSDGVAVDPSIKITDETTIGQLMNALDAYGITLDLNDDDPANVYLEMTSNSGYKLLANGTCNAVTALGLTPQPVGDYAGYVEYFDADATSGFLTEDTLLSSINPDNGHTTGSLIFTLGSDSTNHIINITSTDTIGDLIDKFEAEGVTAKLDNGVLKIDNGTDGITLTRTGTSKLILNMSLASKSNLYQYAVSDEAVKFTSDVTLSVSNYADGSTLLSAVDITTDKINSSTKRSFSIYVDNVKQTFEVDNSTTFSSLFKAINDEYGGTVTAGFLDIDGNITEDSSKSTGVIGIKAASGHTVQVGSSSDTTNFATAVSLEQVSETNVSGSRALYKVNTSSKIMDSGLFRKEKEEDPDVTAGTFKIGDAEFTIDANTTISGLIREINTSETSYATAYWDSLSGTLVLESSITGESLINIEKGTSNFTDILGLTNNSDIVADSQTLGTNAVAVINGTSVSSTSNTISGDISRIEGLTLNLYEASNEIVTIDVTQNTDGVKDAITDVVDAYNAMMEQLETEISSEGNFSNDSLLKNIKNKLKNMMTSSFSTTSSYKNLSSMGISTGVASTSISTDVTDLVIDEDTLINALKTNADDFEESMITKFTSVYNVVNQMLSTSGYFTTNENAINKQITKNTNKITKLTDALAVYRESLTNKFSTMETLISKMQQSYSSIISS